MKENYPLPWCDKFDIPYHALNMLMIFEIEGYREFQSKKSMSELIPIMDKMFEEEIKSE